MLENDGTGGKIVERGSHADLMAIDGGVYNNLVNLQAKKGAEDAEAHVGAEAKSATKEGELRISNGAPAVAGSQAHPDAAEPRSQLRD